ncbi:MAG: hypothetical protein ACI8ZN_002266 [Bacteroidia bacterium]|jgi:hypothetical protein
MSIQVLTYLLYLIAIFAVVTLAGNHFYKHGAVYLTGFFPTNPEMAFRVNKLLRLAYYLLNIGYSILALSRWTETTNAVEMISSLANNLGIILLIIGGLHFNNQLVIYLIALKINKNKISTYK